MNEIKNKNRAQWVVAILLVFAMLAGMLGMFGGCGKPSEEKGTETEQTGAGGMKIEMNNKTDSPVMLTAKQTIATEEGISAQTESSFHLTATVDPSDAINKTIDYIAEWENGGSSWASGKNVSDYIEIAQLSDGSGEADIRCKQAFGEPIIVSAVIRDNESLRDSCKFNYTQKYIGADYTIRQKDENLNTILEWNFNHSNLNPTVDFINLDSSYQDGVDLLPCSAKYIMTYLDHNKFEDSHRVYHSNTYTKGIDKSGNYVEAYIVEVAATQTYLDALYAAGFKTTASAEEYTLVSNFGSSDSTFGAFVLNAFINGDNGGFTYQNYLNLRNRLRDLTSLDMLRVKVKTYSDMMFIFPQGETIYNVKFSASSVSPLAASVSLNAHKIDF